MTAPTPAPLAQLRDVDTAAWSYIFRAEQDPNPGTDVRSQALAAALLGDLELARHILESGKAAIFVTWFPDLRGAGNEITIREALDGGIFAINTWLHPQASADRDVDWLENNAEAVVDRLHTLREHLPKREPVTT